MDIYEAWGILGKDLNKITINLKNIQVISDRVNAIIQIKDEAKKIARKLMAENHPDKGGSTSRFILIQEALKFIESKTEDLINSYQSMILERKQKKKTFIEIK